MKLDDNFYVGEIIEGVYVPRLLKEIWAVNLDLLEVFQNFCNQYSLKFYIGFGTLLGAFRHQGFVPWDDDVDILMPRPEFERLKGLWGAFKYPYFLQNELSEKDFWYRGMMKFRRTDTTCLTEMCYKKKMNQGIALEIMPLDEVSDIAIYRRQQEHNVGHWQRLLWAGNYSVDYNHCNQNDDYRDDIEWKRWQDDAAKYTNDELQQKYLNECRRYEGIGGKQYALFIGYSSHDEYKLLNRAWFTQKITFEFNGLSLPAPIGFWECLESLYGKDFITYVPASERNSHHPALWDVKKPYIFWQKALSESTMWQGKRVIIFGTGSMAEAFWQENKDRLPNNTICLDNNVQMQGRMFHDMPVYAVDIVMEIPDEIRHIIICNGYYREIGIQLEQMGIYKYYVWVDDNKAIFQEAVTARVGRRYEKKYRIMGIIIDNDILDIDLLYTIKNAKIDCEYLIAYVKDIKMQQILDAICYVNRVVLIDEANEAENSYMLCEKVLHIK